MNLSFYVDGLRNQLLIAADAGGEEARLLADRLVAPLESAIRLVLLDALSDAASEITSDLAPGSVEVRLRGRDPEFVVQAPALDLAEAVDFAAAGAPPHDAERAPSGSPGQVGESEEGGTSRITLRLPEPLKLRIENAAGREGLSVNSWLVRTLAGVVEPATEGARGAKRSPSGGERFTGWVRS